jgi:cytochrome c peroxidase
MAVLLARLFELRQLLIRCVTMSMRPLYVLLMVLCAAGAASLWKLSSSGERPAEASFQILHAEYRARIDSLDATLRALSNLPAEGDAPGAQAAFRRARSAYKRMEYLVEFYDAFKPIALNYVEGPFMVPALNGPPIPTVDEENPQSVLAPTGFQVIEAALFPEPSAGFMEVVRREVDRMRQVVQVMRSEPAESLEADRRALDAARLEIARIATLGIAGFDATVSGDGLAESAEALRGVRDGLRTYDRWARKRDPAGWAALDRSLGAAIDDLGGAPSFEEFDRFAFITRFVGPLTHDLQRLEQALELPPSRYPGAWAPGATNVYAPRALDSHWFAPDYAPRASPELIAVGRQLFFDPVLSLSGRRSCATCHVPTRAFTDGRVRAAVDPGHGLIRNTPTLLNAGLQAFQFADQRVRYLEFQVEDVMQNPREMAQPVDSAAVKLGKDTALVARVAAALGHPESLGVTGRTVAVALAAYVRSLEALGSRFDRAVQGDATSMSESERRGFNLFMGKAKCATCHFPPLFGGTTPPSYREAEPEVIGVPARRRSKQPTVDPDPGVFAITRNPLHRHAFKTPNLRNVDLTSPYMHNGVFRTIEEVVDFYDGGGGHGLGIRLENQTLPPDSLHLSDAEKEDLVAFHGTLTDTSSTAPERP